MPITENKPSFYKKISHRGRSQWIGLTAILFVVAWLAMGLADTPRSIQAQVTSGITFPTSGSTVSGQVTVLGTATIGGFQRYELYYKPSSADDSAYTYFADGVEEVVDGPLGVWDTSDLPADEYTLRLRVVRGDANYSEFFTTGIFVDPEATPAPMPPSALTPLALTPSGAGALITPSSGVSEAEPIGVARPISGTVARTITMLGRGVASAPPDRALVRLFITSANAGPTTGFRLISEADLESVVSILQATGTPPEEIRTIPFSRLPDGSAAASEVRFTYRQTDNLSAFLATALSQLADIPAIRMADIGVKFGVANCAPLEEEALRAAILAARARAEPMARVLNVRLGPVLSVSENVAAVPVTGSCLDLLDETAFMPLRGDTPTTVEVAVTLAVTFVMDQLTGTVTPAPATPTPTAVADFPTPTPTVFDNVPTPTPGSLTHTVTAGDTIEGIAGFYGVSVEAILAANNLTQEAGQALQQGQTLIIPANTSPDFNGGPTPTPQDSFTHTVTAGQTIEAIATSYGVSVEEILAANNLTQEAGQALQQGQTLIIP